MNVFKIPDWLRTPHRDRSPAQITTFWGFYRWLEQQGTDANLGTAIMSRRFKQVPIHRLQQWWYVAERETARRLRPVACPYSGLAVGVCKSVDLCDCFDFGDPAADAHTAAFIEQEMRNYRG